MNQATVLAVVITALLGSGLGVIYTKHQSRKLFIELQSLQRYRDDLEIEWGMLQLEQSTLVTGSAVDYAARTRLKMVVPDPDSVVYIAR